MQRTVSERSDGLAVAEELDAAVVLADPLEGLVEDAGFAVGGENVEVKEGGYGALYN